MRAILVVVVGVVGIARPVRADECADPPWRDVQKLVSGAEEDKLLAKQLRSVYQSCVDHVGDCKMARDACQRQQSYHAAHGGEHDESALLSDIRTPWLGETWMNINDDLLSETPDSTFGCGETSAQALLSMIDGRDKIASHHYTVIREWNTWHGWAESVTARCRTRTSAGPSGQQDGSGSPGGGSGSPGGGSGSPGGGGNGTPASGSRDSLARQKAEEQRRAEEARRQEMIRRQNFAKGVEERRQQRVAAGEAFNKQQAAEMEAHALGGPSGGNQASGRSWHFHFSVQGGLVMVPVMTNGRRIACSSSLAAFCNPPEPSSQTHTAGGLGPGIELGFDPIFGPHFGVGVVGGAIGGFTKGLGDAAAITGTAGVRVWFGSHAGVSFAVDASRSWRYLTFYQQSEFYDVGTDSHLVTEGSGTSKTHVDRIGGGIRWCRYRSESDPRFCRGVFPPFNLYVYRDFTPDGDATVLRTELQAFGLFSGGLEFGWSYPAAGDADVADAPRSELYVLFMIGKSFDLFGEGKKRGARSTSNGSEASGTSTEPMKSVVIKVAPAPESAAPTDQDADGFIDAVDKCPAEPESKNGIDDADGCPEPLVVVTTDALKLLEPVRFAPGSAELASASARVLDETARLLIAHAEITKVRIEGHTDNVGDRAQNERLSLAQANAVLRYLIQRGVDASRLEAVGRGGSLPIDDNGTETGREHNRRIELHIVRQ